MTIAAIGVGAIAIILSVYAVLMARRAYLWSVKAIQTSHSALQSKIFTIQPETDNDSRDDRRGSLEPIDSTTGDKAASAG